MSLRASQLQRLKPVLMEITCLPARPCSVALGMVKITLNPKGFVAACLQDSLKLYKYKAGAVPSKLSMERTWPLNDPKPLILPPWQPLQEPKPYASLLPRFGPREDEG